VYEKAALWTLVSTEVLPVMQSFPPGHLAATKPEGGAQLRQGFGFGVPVSCFARDSLLQFVGERGADVLSHEYPFSAYT
jgi:hypothetical protein